MFRFTIQKHPVMPLALRGIAIIAVFVCLTLLCFPEALGLESAVMIMVLNSALATSIFFCGRSFAKYEEEDFPGRDAIIRSYTEKLPARILEMDAAAESANWEQLALLAHKLKPAAMFGYPELGEIARDLERAVKGGQNQQALEKLTDLKAHCKKITSTCQTPQVH